jgi:hypothetical protein
VEAIVAAGVPEEDLREVCHKNAPFGSYKLPVIIWALKRPVAKYFLSFPIVDGNKSVKFNIETFQEISQWLTQNHPAPQNSITTASLSSS